MRDEGIGVVFVLGDPAYYGRLGFEPDRLIDTPVIPIPDEWAEAWQSLYLDEATKGLAGKLDVPPEWRNPAWWGP